MQINRIYRLIKTAKSKQAELNALLLDIENLIAPHLEYDRDDYHLDIFADEARSCYTQSRLLSTLLYGDSVISHLGAL